MARSIGSERLLEVGLVVAFLLLAGGGAVVLFGRVSGGAERGRRERKAPPRRGSVPGGRHGHTAAVSAR
jgi:hypothetical protein